MRSYDIAVCFVLVKNYKVVFVSFFSCVKTSFYLYKPSFQFCTFVLLYYYRFFYLFTFFKVLLRSKFKAYLVDNPRTFCYYIGHFSSSKFIAFLHAS